MSEDADAARWTRLLAAMGEETDDTGRILRPEIAVELIRLCWCGRARLPAQAWSPREIA
jgi:hypothetical protein